MIQKKRIVMHFENMMKIKDKKILNYNLEKLILTSKKKI